MKPQPPGAVASLVFGVLALLAGFTPIALGIWAFLAWYMPILGFGFGIVAISLARRANGSHLTMPEQFAPSGIPTAGLVTGIIGLVLSILVGLWCLVIIGLIGALINAASTGLSQPTSEYQPLLW